MAICRALRAGFVFRRSSVSVSILTRRALQNAWSFRERARLARRNSVSTRLIAFSPEPRDEFLDAAAEGAHEDALFLSRGREVAVAIDLGHGAASAFGRAEAISLVAVKSTLRMAPGAEQPITECVPRRRWRDTARRNSNTLFPPKLQERQ